MCHVLLHIIALNSNRDVHLNFKSNRLMLRKAGWFTIIESAMFWQGASSNNKAYDAAIAIAPTHETVTTGVQITAPPSPNEITVSESALHSMRAQGQFGLLTTTVSKKALSPEIAKILVENLPAAEVLIGTRRWNWFPC